jgi:predicted nucleotidyltransferase
MANLKDNERAALRKLREALAGDFGLVGMQLIGSRARGDADADSDIDLVVTLKGEHDWRVDFAIYDLCFEVGFEHDGLLQPVMYSRGNSTAT